MDIVLCSSRGRELEEDGLLHMRHANPHNLRLVMKPGGTYRRLANKVRPLLVGMTEREKQECNIFLFAGLCDVTLKDQDEDYYPGVPYDEVLFNESPQEAYTRVVREIRYAEHTIQALGPKPIFCTIVPSSLQKLNTHRLKKGYTAFLMHYTHYDDMQHLLNQTIHTLNNKITEINLSNHVFTPRMGETILTNKSRNQSGTGKRIHYSRLWDGCHPDENLVIEWADKLSHSIFKNRLDRDNLRA